MAQCSSVPETREISGPDHRTLIEGGSSGLPAHRIVSTGTGSVFRYEYLTRENAGLIYTPLKSTDPATGPWQPLESTPLVTPVNDDWLRVVHEEPNAIPFHDGVPNLIKYAFNLNLAAADRRRMAPGGTAGLPHVSRVPGDTPAFRVEYLRRLGAGLNYLPQTSSSLAAGEWEPISGTPQITPVDASWERVIHEIPATAERMFGRVGVELGP